MVRAYVMVKANTGDADGLKGTIEGIEGVERAAIVAGDVDIIVTATLEDTAAVKALVTEEIQSIDGVEDTNTYLAISDS